MTFLLSLKNIYNNDHYIKKCQLFRNFFFICFSLQSHSLYSFAGKKLNLKFIA